MKNKLIIISPYPKKSTYSHRESALASFNKNLVDSIKSKFDIAILDDQRIWKKNDFFNYFKLLKKITQYKDIKNVLIQFEWGVFGKSIYFILTFPFFLLALKLLGKKNFVVLHGVNFNFKPIFGKSLKSEILKRGSYVFYNLICFFSDKIIVTENHFKKQLSRLSFGKNKVVFIPHGVDIKLKKKPNNKILSKKINLGYFGYLNPYKGPKKFLDLFTSINCNNYSLTFFGGESPNLADDKNYQKYMKDFYLKSKKNKIRVTGFVDENKLNKYFSNINLVVFPYLAFISSSGMLALTFSFEKPFILSKALEGYFDSPDFKKALKETGLKKEDFLFDFNKESFEKRLKWAKKNLDKLSKFSSIMKEKRDWKKVAKQYEKLLKQI